MRGLSVVSRPEVEVSDPSIRSAPAAAAAAPAWAPRLDEVLRALAVVAALVAAYRPSFRFLVDQWERDPNYSYGFFVIPIAAVILWTRRDRLDRARIAPRWWGLLPLLAVVALRFPLYEANEQFIETATIPLVAAAAVLALGGWHLLEVAYPALIFLVFMLPLPASVNQHLAAPLQQVATQGSVALLQALGRPVMAEGNVIIVGATPLEVARACNGLSMLLSFVTLIAATVILVRRPLWERVILLLSAIPIALISNILRIAATALCYHRFGARVGEEIAHASAGWLMMPLALGMVWLELGLMSWLVVEVEEVDAADLLRQRQRRGGGPVVR
jgi:exosortase